MVDTEFGAKISASVVDGMSRVEHISWDQFNEASDLELQVNLFKKRLVITQNWSWQTKYI